MKRYIDRFATPIGELALLADAEGRLVAAGFTAQHKRMRDLEAPGLVPKKDPGGLSAKLKRYFAGDLGIIDDLPIALEGTPFQRTVWNALRGIPTGTTWSYAALAKHIGRPTAIRAVGLANGMNPICVIVPCHRVIGSDGSLTGYGGGLARKKWLLAHERAVVPG